MNHEFRLVRKSRGIVLDLKQTKEITSHKFETLYSCMRRHLGSLIYPDLAKTME